MHKEKVSSRKRRGQLITIGVIVAVGIAIGLGVYNYVQNPSRTAKFGAVGSTHEHAQMLLLVNNKEPVDFSQPQYQLKSRYIHFEDNNGDIVHLHATNVDLGFLFETLGMKFTNNCITIDKDYCNDGTNTLKFYVNGVKNDMYDKYVLKDGDKILISYGAESEEEIKEQLKMLDMQSEQSKK